MIDRRFVGQSRCRDAFWSLFLPSIVVKYTGGEWEDFALPSEDSCIVLVPKCRRLFLYRLSLVR